MKGNRPAIATLPLLKGRVCRLRFVFDDPQRCRYHARVHKADRYSAQAPLLDLRVNGHRFEVALPTGLGIRNSDPAHRAFPAAGGFDLPGGTLLEGSIGLEACV